jgi:hypothetical protein
VFWKKKEGKKNSANKRATERKQKNQATYNLPVCQSVYTAIERTRQEEKKKKRKGNDDALPLKRTHTDIYHERAQNISFSSLAISY